MIRTACGVRRLIGWAALGLFFSGGCTLDPKAEEQTEDPAAEAAQACEDYADAVASSGARCGHDYQANYDAFVQGAGATACTDFKSIRDIDALYKVCIPFLKSLTCAQVDDPGLQLPDECKSQLFK